MCTLDPHSLGFSCWFKRHCPECQKLEFAKVAAKGAVNSLHVTQIGEEMSVDVIGPLPKTKDGYEFIIRGDPKPSAVRWR
jgi:hypothetical protein